MKGEQKMASHASRNGTSGTKNPAPKGKSRGVNWDLFAPKPLSKSCPLGRLLLHLEKIAEDRGTSPAAWFAEWSSRMIQYDYRGYLDPPEPPGRVRSVQRDARAAELAERTAAGFALWSERDHKIDPREALERLSRIADDEMVNGGRDLFVADQEVLEEVEEWEPDDAAVEWKADRIARRKKRQAKRAGRKRRENGGKHG